MRRLGILLLCFFQIVVLQAQQVAPRANVVAYDDDDAIADLAYRDSPYFMEIPGSWRQRRTDSSIVYSRNIDVAKTWKDYNVFLNVRCGRAVIVKVDGAEVGRAEDSRLWAEFLLDSRLRYGKTVVLEVEAVNGGKGAMLEDSSLSIGLNGEPFLSFKSNPGIEDYTLVADYDAERGSGTLSVDATVVCEKRKGRYYLEVEVWNPQGRQLDRMGQWVIFGKKSEESVDISRSWNNIQPWSAEQPQLYTVVMRLHDEKMNVEEVVGAKVGFRRIEMKDGSMLLNGRQVNLKGVSYGLDHTEGFASRRQMELDLLRMKASNINAVHTTRFSPMEPYFYELCDKIGLYVVADANLMPLSTRKVVVATDKNYIPLFEQRVENLYGKYKNHTSIIAWSLGNTMDNGVCMTAAFRRLKAIEKNRPVIFKAVGFGENTDFVALHHPSVKDVRQAVKRLGDRSALMLPAVGADDFSAVEDLWGELMLQRKLQGCFVDKWPLSSVESDDVRQLFSPLSVSILKVGNDIGEFLIHNNNDFGSFAGYELDYVIYTNQKRNIVGGELPIAVKAGETEKLTLRIPEVETSVGEELFIHFTLTDKALKSAGKAAEVGSAVFQLQAERRSIESNARPEFSGVDEEIARKVELSFEGYSNWHSVLIDTVIMRLADGTVVVQAMRRYFDEGENMMCEVNELRQLLPTGDCVVEYNVSEHHKGSKKMQAVVRVSNSTADSIAWFGLERETSLSRSNGNPVGTYMSMRKPLQRQQVRWCAMFGGKNNDGFLAQIMGERYMMRVTEDAIELLPSQSGKFTLRLRRGSGPDDVVWFMSELPQHNIDIVPPPVIEALNGRFSQAMQVRIYSTHAGTIRYTVDGSDPDVHSPIYSAPIQITSTTTVRARLFPKDAPPSFTATRRFNYDYIVSTTLSRKPNTPYNVGTDSLLFDGIRGDAVNLSQGWLGFSGKAPVVEAKLGKPIHVDSIVVGFSHSPEVWAFAPTRVLFSWSEDGVNYSEPVTVESDFIVDDEQEVQARVVDVGIRVDAANIVSVRIEPEVIRQIPSWHHGAGLKPWLMIDELRIIEK